MSNTQKKDPKAAAKQANILEKLRNSGSPSMNSSDFLSRLLGMTAPNRKYSGELSRGENLEVNDVFSGTLEENKKLRAQIMLERKLAEEERALREGKTNQLKLQLQALIQEITALEGSTQKLAREAEVAMIQAPTSPGIYHVNFFKNLLSFLKSFREKIEEASVWLSASNKRAEKKNYWAMYKKKGSSFLLAPDHYLSRAAG